jgi:chaperonin cofactor prefoldin
MIKRKIILALKRREKVEKKIDELEKRLKNLEKSIKLIERKQTRIDERLRKCMKLRKMSLKKG